METVIDRLSKRRKIMFFVLLCISLVAIMIDRFFEIPVTSYFGEENNIYIVYGLITYKLIELSLLYLIFYRRHFQRLLYETHTQELLAKFEKGGKRFFMLVPHGSTIFGMISYKLTTDIYIFLLFMFIALITLFLVKPRHQNSQ